MDINTAITEAISLSANNDNQLITFEFNNVLVNVLSTSNSELLYRDYFRAINGSIEKAIGPSSELVLTKEEEEIEDSTRFNNERKARRSYREAQDEREIVKKKLVKAPPMMISDEVAWQLYKDENKDINNNDWLSILFITHIENWTRLMQVEMAKGKTLEEVVDIASYYASKISDIPSIMFLPEIAAIVKYWKYGDQFRRWHNSKFAEYSAYQL